MIENSEDLMGYTILRDCTENSNPNDVHYSGQLHFIPFSIEPPMTTASKDESCSTKRSLLAIDLAASAILGPSFSDQNPYNVDHRPSHVCKYPSCDKTFTTKYALKHHMYIHSGHRPYACSYPGCMLHFRHWATLAYHEQTHLPEDKREKLKCSYPDCKRTFTRRRILEEHLYAHAGERPFACDYPGCGASFAYVTAKRRHLKVHVSEDRRERFACHHSGCDRVYLCASSLEGHLNKHAGAKPYACDAPGCDCAYAYSSSLRYHKRTSHSKASQTEKFATPEPPDYKIEYSPEQPLTKNVTESCL